MESKGQNKDVDQSVNEDEAASNEPEGAEVRISEQDHQTAGQRNDDEQQSTSEDGPNEKEHSETGVGDANEMSEFQEQEAEESSVSGLNNSQDTDVMEEDDAAEGKEASGSQLKEDDIENEESVNPVNFLDDENSRDSVGRFSEASTDVEPVESSKYIFEDEGQSLDTLSMRSEERSAREDEESRDIDAIPETSKDKSDTAANTTDEAIKDNNNEDDSLPHADGIYEENNSNSRLSNSENPETMPEHREDEMVVTLDLGTDEILGDETEEVVADVDISSMMEMNMDEESESYENNQSNNEEPEVIPIDSDEGESDNRGLDKSQEEDDESQMMPVTINQNIFEVEDDDEEIVTEMDISNMMEVQVSVDETEVESCQQNDNDESFSPSRRPRRAAAEAAAKTIHQISTEEENISGTVFRHRRKSQEDLDYDTREQYSTSPAPAPSTVKQRCHVCKKSAPCSIVVRQYGADLFLCSNPCFSQFRSQGKECKSGTLPCSKCGMMDGDSPSDDSNTYFWETMNFCSDLCVGRYQMDVGCKCCTCGKDVPWGSLGKYCVRFGSDIRQFCLPQCLEGYKKNARVCFNCQLDIRRVGNVIMANIPAKSAPKEFCSNDCVEMYCERNFHQPVRAKIQPEHACCQCNMRKLVYKELVLQTGSFKTCSDYCWQSLLRVKSVSKAEKCEKCTKFVNMDLGFTTPVYWLSAMNKVFGFCSHVCKNMFILDSRRILACTSCKVKKYNYDLIEYFTNSSSAYAVCSLACLPKNPEYLKNVRDVLYLPQPTSDRVTSLGANSSQAITVMNSASSLRGPRSRRNQHVEDQDNSVMVDSTSYEFNDMQGGEYYEDELDSLTVEQLDAILNYIDKVPPEMKSKSCSAKPRTRTIETQTEVSELNEMERIPLKIEEIVHYVPVPIPCLISVPFPGYFLESPTPIPFPLPIPFPVPIPVIFSSDEKERLKSKSVRERTEDEESVASKKDTSCVSEASAIENAREPVNVDKIVEHTLVEDNSMGELNHQQSSSSTSDSASAHSGSSTTGKVLSSPPASFSTPVYSGVPVPVTQTSSYTESASDIPQVVAVPPITNYGMSVQQSPVGPSVPITDVPYQFSAPTNSYNTSVVGMPSAGHMPLAAAPSPIISFPGSYGSPGIPPPDYSTPVPPPSTVSTVMSPNSAPKNARVEYALRAWKMMFGASSDPRCVSSVELSSKLTDLVNRGFKPNGERYRADILLYISLGIQQMLRENSRIDKLFYDSVYYNFVLAITEYAERELTVGIQATIEEVHFWETFELGASSPGVILFTLIFMFQKYFGLKTWEMLAALQFSHIIISSRYDQFGRPVRYLTVMGLHGAIPTEIQEDLNCPERCLIKIYDFYRMMSESQMGVFFKCPRHDYTPRTPWFNSQPLDKLHIYQMLVRASMIRNTGSIS